MTKPNSAILKNLPVDDVKLDTTNPRIRRFLETYQGDDPTPEQIYLALGAGGDDEDSSGTSFEKLKNSIMTNGGIIHPIIVNEQEDRTLVCIEGNTRLALYQSFKKDGVEGAWDLIPALVYSAMDVPEVDAIRLQIHLVGTRQWDPYSKAKYLYNLRTQKLMPFAEIVDYSGGRQREIQELIQAYTDMEQYYRPVLPDDGIFDVTRFSGFVELQKVGMKTAIAEAGFTLTDFAKWIHEEKLYPLSTVRMLPKILRNKEAREIFLKTNAREAAKAFDKPDMHQALQDASVAQLASALAQSIYGLSWKDAELIRTDATNDAGQALNEVMLALKEFLNP